MSEEKLLLAPAKRDPFIDVARLLTMLFIVIWHVHLRSPYGPPYSHANSPEISIITFMTFDVKVYFFFFFAGYFAKVEKYSQSWRRGFSIFVSMLFWCLIGYFFFGWLMCQESGNFKELQEKCTTSIWQILGSWTSSHTPGSMDCWFLKALIPMVLCSPVLARMKSSWLVGVMCLVYMLGAGSKNPEYSLYFFDSDVLNGFSFFVGGMVLRRWMSIEELKRCISENYIAVILVSVLLLVGKFFFKSVDMSGGFIYFAWGIIYVLSLSMALCKWFPRFAAWFASYGSGVFFIYMGQEMLVYFCKWFFTLHYINRHVYTLVPFCIFLVLMMGYAIIRRYMPWACGVLCLAPERKCK